ncbi:hypothetical protein [Sorangium sp. So ce854]|uniref:hypothetical protein n=1 Tax=Sorangium sp. So ce854 TaxID=3133322 RepID=UPI003F5D8D73
MFTIQAPAPQLRAAPPTSYVSVGGAIRGVFKRFTESMFWIWRGVPLAIGYAEPFGVIYRDVLGFVEACLAADRGAGRYGFHEADVIAHWDLAWGDGALRIDAIWYAAPGGLEKVLQERARIEVPLAEFLAEWKMPLRRVLDAFDRVGVTIEEEPDVLLRLRAAEAAIPAFGWRYGDG